MNLFNIQRHGSGVSPYIEWKLFHTDIYCLLFYPNIIMFIDGDHKLCKAHFLTMPLNFLCSEIPGLFLRLLQIFTVHLTVRIIKNICYCATLESFMTYEIHIRFLGGFILSFMPSFLKIWRVRIIKDSKLHLLGFYSGIKMTCQIWHFIFLLRYFIMVQNDLIKSA